MDKTFKMTNDLMVRRADSLEPFLDRDDFIGYIAARNVRKLQEESMEYTKFRNDIIGKYGTKVTDENGNETGEISLPATDPHFDEVISKIEEFANIKHEVTIFTITYDDVKGKLTGREILQIDWMIEDN